jgi:hypothetical protein
MHSVLTGVQVLVTRTADHAHRLVHFAWGFHIVTTGKGKALKISYSDARSLIPFSWVSYCDIRERDFIYDYDSKEKEHQNTRQSDLYSGASPSRTNQIASGFDALSITKGALISAFI